MSTDGSEYADVRAALRALAANVTERLDSGDEDAVEEAIRIADHLRANREFDLLEPLADAVRSFRDPEGRMTKFLAQSLIELGRARIAVDVLKGLVSSLPDGIAGKIDAMGVLGRAWKQQFFDTPDRSNSKARRAFQEAVDAYAAAWEASGRTSDYVGVNLAALLAYASRNEVNIKFEGDAQAIAQSIIVGLNMRPEAQRDAWYHASMAEALIALGDLEQAKDHVAHYVRSPSTDAFAIGGTIRQFTDLWCLGQHDQIGPGILDALRAAALSLPGGYIELSADTVERVRTQPISRHAEVVLGHDGFVTHRMLKQGLNQALSVAAVERDGVGRIGTGFVVRGGDFVPQLGDEPCLLTNAHVVNADGALGAPPDECEAAFEIPPPGARVRIQEIIWSSPEKELDAALLRLQWGADTPPALRITHNLPLPDGRQRVYVIGHPQGRELTYSLQDNVLLEHEGSADSTPVDSAVRKLHYRAPTEPGSSGSPVFNSGWKVIGLHRAGGLLPRLNGQAGVTQANEGVWIRSIAEGAAQMEI